MVEIIPAVMPQHYNDLDETVNRVVGHATMVQIDIMDGKFVHGKTWPYVGHKSDWEEILSEAKGLPAWNEIDYEVDLMISHPEEVIEDWITAGAARIIVHVESTTKLGEIVKNFRERFAYSPEEKEIELGFALNLETSLDIILPHLEDIDFVQFMGIATIGVQGSELDERVLDKMRTFHNAHPEVILSVDGGVTLDNARILVDAGARRLVSGSAILKSLDVGQAIDAFRDTVL